MSGKNMQINTFITDSCTRRRRPSRKQDDEPRFEIRPQTWFCSSLFWLELLTFAFLLLVLPEVPTGWSRSWILPAAHLKLMSPILV